ncbi:hypothetical protein GQ457_10G020000 [Hibiscus cannabinus]
MDKLHNLFSAQEIEAISSIPIGENHVEDAVVWFSIKDVEYSVKFGLTQSCDNQIWGQSVPPKLKMFIWKACHNIISTKSLLSSEPQSLVIPLLTSVFLGSPNYGRVCVSNVAGPEICTVQPTMTENWTPPSIGYVKANCDASFDRVTCNASAAVVFRNDKRHIVGGASSRFI